MSTSFTHADVIFIGIAGPSGCGKSTYAKHLVDHLGSPCNPIELDHFFLPPPIIEHPILGWIENWEKPECLNIEVFFILLQQIKQNPQLITRYHRSNVQINSNQRIFIIIEGFLLFALSDNITNSLDIKIFLDSTLSECRVGRYRRQKKIPENLSNEHVQVSNRFQQWFDHLVWKEYLKHRDFQMAKADKIFHSHQYKHKQYTTLDDYIAKRVKEQ